MEDTADYYAFYVLILGIPGDVFWMCDCAFVCAVADDMAAYNGWKTYAEYAARKKAEQRKKKPR